MDIYFSRKHRAAAVRGRSDRGWGAALVILTAKRFREDIAVWKHVDSEGIDWPAIIAAGPWSFGERALLHVAASAFGSGAVDLWHITAALDDESWTLVQKCLRRLRAL